MIYKYNFSISYCFKLTFIVFLFFIGKTSTGQIINLKENSNYLLPSDTLNKKRVVNSLVLSGSTYAAMSVGFYHLWYKKHELESFHTFNDWHEWQKMDKIGHLYGAYVQSAAGYKLAKWTGVSDTKAIWSGVFLSTLAQSTIEIMDGFSSKWGFSYGDVAFNTIGTTAFALQQHFWKEQKITFKVSNIPINYSTKPIRSTDGKKVSSLAMRARSLYGDKYYHTFLKDYNAQTIWTSFNIKSIFNTGDIIPDWLNIAVGYSAENMFGGFDNRWMEGRSIFVADIERYGQFFIAPDIDFWRIRTKSPFLNTLLDVANGFHIPLPALEINTKGEFHFHFFM